MDVHLTDHGAWVSTWADVGVGEKRLETSQS